MLVEDIIAAASAASREFGRPYEAPIELVRVVPQNTMVGMLTVDLNDLRKVICRSEFLDRRQYQRAHYADRNS